MRRYIGCVATQASRCREGEVNGGARAFQPAAVLSCFCGEFEETNGIEARLFRQAQAVGSRHAGLSPCRPPGNAGRKWPAEVLTPARVRALINEFAPAAAGTRERAKVLLMYRAEIKIGEALAMERRHFEPGEHQVIVPESRARPERTVAIDLETREALEAWLRCGLN